MAHLVENLGQEAQDASAFFVGEPAWHGLGKVVKEAKTAEEAIKLANLDFTVEKADMFMRLGRQQIAVPDRQAIYRTDLNTVLGIGGENWTPVQNREAFIFFDSIIDRGEAIFVAGGVLDGGKKVWLLAKFPETIRIGESEDVIEQYCLLVNAFTGRDAVTAQLTDVRVVCHNTLTMALNERGVSRISVPHTLDVLKNLKKASELLGLKNVTQSYMSDLYNHLATLQMNEEKVNKFLDTLYPLNPENEARTAGVKIRESIMEGFEGNMPGSGKDFAHSNGTAWGMFNAVTHHFTHKADFKDANHRMKSNYFGTGARKGQLAIDTLLEICN